MPPDRDHDATPSAPMLDALRRSWPPTAPPETRGYRPLDLRATEPVAVLGLGAERALVVVARPDSPPTALPCLNDPDGWRVAVAGDGLAHALLSRLGTVAAPVGGGFALARLTEQPPVAGSERELGTDQSNISVVVGDTAIVKWRTAPGADGRRATRLRRHLQASRFPATPGLLASLTWTDDTGETWVLADVDAYLPDAIDGWDDAIGRLHAAILADTALDHAYAAELGRLTAALHAALLSPSRIIGQPTRMATPAEMAAIRVGGQRLLRRCLAIEAADQHEVIARAAALAAANESLPTDATMLGPIHGDLHIGQLVAWRDGLAIVDFDGAPEPAEPVGDVAPPARDVAQMICSLWNLAAVVDARSGGAQRARLRAWAEAAERAYLDTYRESLPTRAMRPLDDRLLEPFIAEQLCRELLYADSTLPRWRYAPLQALRWRYPLRPHDDG